VLLLLSLPISLSCSAMRISAAPTLEHKLGQQDGTTVGFYREIAAQVGRQRGYVIGAETALDWTVPGKGISANHDYSFGAFAGYSWNSPLRYQFPMGFEMSGGLGWGRSYIHARYAPVLRPTARIELPIRPYRGDALWKSERMFWPDIMIVPFFKATLLTPTSGPDGARDVVPQLGGGIWLRLHFWTSIAP
jgi:hypothetical protein